MTDETKKLRTKPKEPGKGSSDSATLDREELRRLYEESCAGIEEGAIVKGEIIKVSKDEVYVDIGYKSEGLIPLSEFSDPALAKPGEEVDVFVESMEDADGMIVLSRIKAERQKKWDDTIHRSEEGDVVRGKITRKVRGGVIVDIGMDAFLPASQIDVRHVSNVDDYMGKVLEFKIIKINPERKNIVLSRRELLEEERARNREKLLAEIEVGQIREGVVKNITDFGTFVDLYGMDGLLHITDMTWGRINHPSEMLSIGDKVEVMVLDFDRERQRIALGLKQKTANPWENIESKYPVGSIVKGKIVNIVPYGAFFEIEKGVEGLIHISEMSWTKRINHPSEILSVGDEVEAMVLSIKKDEAKISLGIKQTEFNPWSVVEEKYPPGSRVRGRVRNITSYGAFVELEEGIDGLIHISDMSWTRKINHPSEVLKKGEITESLVLAVDQEAKKITLGLKQLQSNPWETIDQFIQVGSVVEAEVTKIADFGVFATIENGIECLIHISQLSDKPFEKIDDIVKKGDKVWAKVDRIDKQRRKIALSIRDYQRDLRLAEEKAAMEAVKAMSLGDESIVGMKEHIEQAVEQLSSSTEAEALPEAGEAAEAGQEVEVPPVSVEQPPETRAMAAHWGDVPEPSAAEAEAAPHVVEAAEVEAQAEVPLEIEEQPSEGQLIIPEPEPPAAPEISTAEEKVGEEKPAAEELLSEVIPSEPPATAEQEAEPEKLAPEERLAEAISPEASAAEREVQGEEPLPEKPSVEDITPETSVEKEEVEAEVPTAEEPAVQPIVPEVSLGEPSGEAASLTEPEQTPVGIETDDTGEFPQAKPEEKPRLVEKEKPEAAVEPDEKPEEEESETVF